MTRVEQGSGSSSRAPWRSVLVVEDNEPLRESLRAALEPRFESTLAAGTLAEAHELLIARSPDVLVLDVVLPDGDAIELVTAAAERGPMPDILAMSGEASSPQVFALAKHGVQVFLSKPVTLADLESALDRLASERPDPWPALRHLVGRQPLPEVEAHVRETLVAEALQKAAGSKRRASGLLGISRQLLQHILRR